MLALLASHTASLPRAYIAAAVAALTILFFGAESRISLDSPSRFVITREFGLMTYAAGSLGIFFGAISGAAGALVSFSLSWPLLRGVVTAALAGAALGVLVGLSVVLTEGNLPDNAGVPNRAVLRTGWHALSVGLATTAFYGLVAAIWFPRGAVGFIAVWVGIVATLGAGGWAVIQHYLLRCTLSWTGKAPYRIVSFLDAAVCCNLMTRLGGSYQFAHPLIADELRPDRGAVQADLVPSVEGGDRPVDDFPAYIREAIELVEHDLRATAPGEWVLTADETGQLDLSHDGRTATASIEEPDPDYHDELRRAVVRRSVADNVQDMVKAFGAEWPHCPFHESQFMEPDHENWTCLARFPEHNLARIGSLSTDHGEIRSELAEVQKPLLPRLRDHGTIMLSMPSIISGEILNSLDLSDRGSTGKAIFVDWHRPKSARQALLPWGSIWALTRQVPGRPFDGVHIPFLPNPLNQFAFAPAIMFLSMAAIDIIVSLPLVLGWAGILSLGQATSVIMLAVAAHACFTPTALQVAVPRSVSDPDEWAKKHQGAALIRSYLFGLPILALVDVIPLVYRGCQHWAAHHNAYPTILFAALIVGGCTLAAALMLYARSRWNLGERRSDDVFREVFWALLCVFIAFLPPAFKANWAPTLFAGIAFPLIITRSRISAAKNAERGTKTVEYWQPIKPK